MYERQRGRELADRITAIFESNRALHRQVDAMLPGIAGLLEERPEDSFSLMTSTEAVVELLKYANPTSGDAFQKRIKNIVDDYVTMLKAQQERITTANMKSLAKTQEWRSLVRCLTVQ